MFAYVGQDKKGQSYKSVQERHVWEDKYTGWLDRWMGGWNRMGRKDDQRTN